MSRHTAAFLATCLLAAAPAHAQMARVATDGIAEAGFIEGWRTANGARIAAVQIRLAPGWHTYWRIPGETGIPPQFDWSRSRNIASVRYEWPQPGIFDTNGMQFFGYEGELVLPVRITPADPSKPIEVDLGLFYGICKDICLPTEQTLRATVAPHDAPSGRSMIEAALATRALTPDEAGVETVDCHLRPDGSGVDLTAAVTFDTPPAADQLALVESSDPSLWIAPPESHLEGSTLVAEARINAAPSGAMLIDRKAIRLTVIDARRVIDIPSCVAPG